MEEVKEVLVSKDEVNERYEEMCSRAGGEGILIGTSQGQRGHEYGDVSVQGGDIKGDKHDIGGKGVGKEQRLESMI